MAVTRKEIADALGMDEQVLIDFAQRGVRLTKRQELESKINNLRSEQAKANETFAAQIQTIEGEIAALNKEIDALGG